MILLQCLIGVDSFRRWLAALRHAVGFDSACFDYFRRLLATMRGDVGFDCVSSVCYGIFDTGNLGEDSMIDVVLGEL